MIWEIFTEEKAVCEKTDTVHAKMEGREKNP